MTVVMKGGASGNRQDGIASMPSGGSQPVLDTSTSGKESSTVHLNSYKFRKHAQTATPDFMPTGGTIPEGSSDVHEQGLPGKP